MQIITVTATFTGTKQLLSSLTGAPARCSKVIVEPAAANANVCYVGDASLALGTSTVDHVIKQIAKPSATDAVLDNFTLEDRQNLNSIHTAQLSVDGTSTQKAKITFFVN